MEQETKALTTRETMLLKACQSAVEALEDVLEGEYTAGNQDHEDVKQLIAVVDDANRVIDSVVGSK